MTVIQNEYGNYIIELPDEKPLYYLFGIRVLNEKEYFAAKERAYKESCKEPYTKIGRELKPNKKQLSEDFIALIRKRRELFEKKHSRVKRVRTRKGNRPHPNTIQEVLKRDNHTCVECGSKDHLDIHHMVYRSQGGTHSVDNLITLCWLCHAEKHKEEPIYNLMMSRIRKTL